MNLRCSKHPSTLLEIFKLELPRVAKWCVCLEEDRLLFGTDRVLFGANRLLFGNKILLFGTDMVLFVEVDIDDMLLLLIAVLLWI